MKRIVWQLVISAIVGSAAAAQAPAPDDPQIAAQPALPEITRGQQISISGKNFAAGVYTIHLLAAAGDPKDGISLPATPSADKQTLTFTVPPDKVATGRYLVWVKSGDKYYPVPGDLRLVADSQQPVTIDAVSPVTAYPGEGLGYDFEISGKNLGNPVSNNALFIVDRGYVSIGNAAQCDTARITKRYRVTCLEAEPGMETRKLIVRGYRRGEYDGPVSLRVQVGSNVSNAVPLTFSHFDKGTVRLITVVVFVMLTATVIGLIWYAVRQIREKREHRLSTLDVVLLDTRTNSYSLSKFQLLLWAAVFVFGYIYLFLCRMLIQAKFELPPVPEGMPGMLAISAGTTVVAAGATVARGPKGSGPVDPGIADFISSGGIVSGERFQFFVWTLVGALAFIAMLLLSNPGTLVELPKIPDTFLYLMGISSVGYLAGKVVGPPGPTIRKLAITHFGKPEVTTDVSKPEIKTEVGRPEVKTDGDKPDTRARAKMILHLIGENLAEDAKVKVDDKPLLVDDYELVNPKPQDQVTKPRLCTEIDLVLKDAEAYRKDSHTVALTNGDGQMASARFPVDPMLIASVTPDASNTTLRVEGKNFADGITAEWRPDGSGAPISATSVTFDKKKPEELTVKFSTALTGPGTLVLHSQPFDLQATWR